jgi:gliding motility-associated-like protein
MLILALHADSCSLEVHFKNLSSSTGGLSYKWYFGDGDSSAETHPVHAYKQTDLYTVILMVNAGSPCADTIEKIFLFDGDTTREIFIPNVFTPNGDGLNDCYSIRGVSPKCDEYKVTIYNRWGEIYFKSTDPSQCWNGKNEAGASASVGVYYYIMSIKKRDQEKMEKHGTITLIRD